MKLSIPELWFYGKEIVELILLKEKQESKLYGKAIENLTQREIVNTLQAFAQISESYQQRLKSWCNQLEPYPKLEEYPGQHQEYMNSLANHIIRDIYSTEWQEVTLKTEVCKAVISAERSFITYLRTYKQLMAMKDIHVLKEALQKQKEHCSLLSNQCEQCL